MKTIDHREQLARLIWSQFRMEPWPDRPNRQAAWFNVADTVIAAGFTRNEASKP